ncbi:hypothetical protein [Phormidesmis sp. 146-33]
MKVNERDKIREVSSEIRRIIEGIAIPEDMSEVIAHFFPGLEKKLPTPSDQAQQQRIYPQPPLQVSRILI